MKRKLLFLDTETGGRNPETDAICSIGAVVLHEGFIDESYYTVINDPSGQVVDEAFATHGITCGMRSHGKSPGQVIEDLEQMFLRHDMRLPRRVVIGAHHADFDIGFVKRLYRLAGAEYHVRFERRFMDLMALAYAMEQAGRIELYGPASLENICKAFGVPLERDKYHNALDDATAAAKAWSRGVAMLRAR